MPPRAGGQRRAPAARLVTRLAEGRTGVHSTVVPAPLWPSGMFRQGVEEDARLTVATAQDGRTAVCLAAEPLPQPHKLPHLPGVDIVVRYVPASRQTEIGGDFYAALRTGEGVLTAVGDVVGHSLDAATVMVEMRHALRAHCVEESDPGALAERLDRMLQHYHPDVTATVCLALVDPGTGRVRIANAGHVPPLIVREGGAAEYAPVSGPLLGLGLDRPEPSELVLSREDRFLMVTDGLIETRGIDLATSMEQLRTAAADAPSGLDAFCDTLLGCFGRAGRTTSRCRR